MFIPHGFERLEHMLSYIHQLFTERKYVAATNLWKKTDYDIISEVGVDKNAEYLRIVSRIRDAQLEEILKDPSIRR
jgi:hypothetical protein